MSEEGDIWRGVKKERQEKKKQNHKQSIKILDDRGIEYETLNEYVCHYRVGEYDFWPSTGRFIHRPTGKKGRGVFNLIKLVKKHEQTNTIQSR